MQAAKWAAQFRDEAVRRGFIRKVLFIVTCMLTFTVGCSLAFYFVHPLKVRPCLRACPYLPLRLSEPLAVGGNSNLWGDFLSTLPAPM